MSKPEPEQVRDSPAFELGAIGFPNLFGPVRDMSAREFHPPHIYEDNACYFLTGSVVHRQHLLNTPAQRALVRDVLKEAIRQYGITLYAWVILSNHYHLLLRVSEVAPLFKFIKRLHGDSAIRLNKLDGMPGRQVWYQYWDRFPRSERDFGAYLNYIHVNPIKHGCVGTGSVGWETSTVLMLDSRVTNLEKFSHR